MGENEESLEVLDAKPSKRSKIIEALVSFGVIVIFCVVTGVLDVYSRGVSFSLKPGTVFADAFSIGGGICVLFWALIWVSQKGAFDIIVYSVGRMIDVIFRLHEENQKMPKNFGDYVLAKRGKKHKHFYYFLIEAGAFFVVGAILSIVFMNEGA